MARGREEHRAFHVGRIDEALVERTIEQEDEVVLGMCRNDPLQHFMLEPADPFQLIGQEQAGVHHDAHGAKVCSSV